MRVQFLEIYNEDVKDLLAPPQEHTAKVGIGRESPKSMEEGRERGG